MRRRRALARDGALLQAAEPAECPLLVLLAMRAYAALAVVLAALDVSHDDRFGDATTIGGRFEITPSLGLGLHSDFDPRGRLPPQSRVELLRMGLTIGALF